MSSTAYDVEHSDWTECADCGEWYRRGRHQHNCPHLRGEDHE